MIFPPIPKNPITLTINGWIVDNYLKRFFSLYLPGYDFLVTSAYRNEVKQREMKERGYKPSDVSAHLYNLARDFVIIKNGRMLSDNEMKILYDSKMKPNWEGYSYFKPKQEHTKTGWIHSNIERTTTKTTGAIGLAAVVAGALWTGKKLLKLKK